MYSVNGLETKTPALLMSVSTCPKRSSAAPTIRSEVAVSAMSPATVSTSGSSDGLMVSALATTAQPSAAVRGDDRGADAPGPARDDCDRLFVVIHARSPPEHPDASAVPLTNGTFAANASFGRHDIGSSRLMTNPNLRELLRRPVVVAPMAGGPSTVALAVAAAEAGVFVFLAVGYKTADAMDGRDRRGALGQHRSLRRERLRPRRAGERRRCARRVRRHAAPRRTGRSVRGSVNPRGTTTSSARRSRRCSPRRRRS